MKFISKILAKLGFKTLLLNVIGKLPLKNLSVIKKPFALFAKVNSKVAIFLSIIILLCITVFLLLNTFVLGKNKNIEHALELGQHVEVFLETGEIKSRASIKGEEQVAATENPEEKKEESSSEEKQDDFSWIKEDYIGPRLPDEIIAALIEGEGKRKQINVKTVSIKDISDKPVVVIIIKGLGLSVSSTKEALELPKEISMGFSPYSPSLDLWIKKVKASGHEALLNIPMETSNFRTNNPGPYSLLTQSPVEDNETRLKMLLGLMKGYDAVYSENSEVFTSAISSIKPVLELLAKEGIYFVYGGGYSNYTMIQVANSINYPVLVNDIVLDDDISAVAITEKFRELEKIAKDKGYVVAMAHPYPITIRILQTWLSQVKDKELVVKPVSVLLGKVFKQ